MAKTLQKHLDAVRSGEVTRTNVIGIRKALNTDARRANGYSTGLTSPKIDEETLFDIMAEIDRTRPRVAGDLHESGLRLLRSKRYAKRLAPYADLIEWPSHFELWGWEAFGRRGGYHVPIYRLVGQNGGSMIFYNIPWQSGGDGPVILR
jgi:hypothetical protein